MLTNRTVTSREYKLMLQADRFRDRSQGAEALWSLIQFLFVNTLGQEVHKKQDKELRRRTWYLDTPGAEFRARGFVLRAREEYDEDGEFDAFKVTLKYRDPDRYVSSSKDMKCTFDGKKKDKFEEDILPPFASKFARSVAFETDDRPSLETVGQATELFPGLAELGIPDNTPVRTVKGFVANEVARHLGKLRFTSMPVPRGEDDPDFVVKCCLTFWYLQSEADEWPLTAEFSFDYDLPNEAVEQTDQLEHFSPEVVAGTNLFFRALQKQVGWLDPSGTTKTAYAFDAL